VLIILLLIVLKTPLIAENISITIRHTLQQSTAGAASTDLRWLGISYLAFRLLHVLRDTRSGRLSPVTLRDFINYAVFFPALTAGPIDRLGRFDRDLHEPVTRSAGDIGLGGQRLVLGLFKKFVLADTLAIFALNPISAGQVNTSGWSWLLLYAFSYQISVDRFIAVQPEEPTQDNLIVIFIGLCHHRSGYCQQNECHQNGGHQNNRYKPAVFLKLYFFFHLTLTP